MRIALGIAGGTGSGKTILARILCEQAPELFSMLELDWYYRDQSHLSLAERERTNYDDPAAIEIDRVITDVHALLSGKPAAAPLYDFAVHTRAPGTRAIEAKSILIVEGIHALGYAPLRKMYWASAFVNTPADVRFIRRLQRDMMERGRTAESVIRQYLEQVRPMHERWVEPARQYATWVLSGEDPIAHSAETVLRGLRTWLDKLD